MPRVSDVFSFLISTSGLFLLWALLTGGFRAQESVMGAGAAVVSSLLFLLVRRCAGDIFRPTWRELAQVRRVPASVVSGSWTVTVVLFKDLFGLARAGSFYRSTRFDDRGESTKRQVTRAALVTALTSITPSSIVIGVDRKSGQMLFHELRPQAVEPMTRSFGAEG